MGCTGCSTTVDGVPKGCGSKGHCGTGSCNKLNTYDWLSKVVLPVDYDEHEELVEVSFKNGSRKEFALNPAHVRAITGDFVAIDTGNGYDVGQVCLTGELVDLQMKKKKVKRNSTFQKILRVANDRDMERLHEAREAEKSTMIYARILARKLKLDMKIGDVEYQGDKRKATFYYIADGRVDFRELIKEYAREFRVKVEMRQIGARQESSRIGGLGSCGRELCCSTWLTDFKSVSTSAAKYQNLALNQTKLSGQCGRLKCCLNYELSTYMDALKHFPKRADVLETQQGRAVLVKTDIFKKTMFYIYREKRNSKIVPLGVLDVHKVLEMNRRGEKPIDLEHFGQAKIEEQIIKDIQFTSDSDSLPEKEVKQERRRKERSGTDRKRKKPRSGKPNSAGERPGEPRNAGQQPGSKSEMKTDKSGQMPRPKTEAKADKPGNESGPKPPANTGEQNAGEQKAKAPRRRNKRRNRKPGDGGAA